ncbi:hypothetical protein QMK61_00405 [Fulvimonas sp. R45]|uniref:hypothetical protein n=1 Tax=Fulvimonas sp. R45 TaxID=3045937 RepID=UPI00265E0E22|nr:hypothetical protein [Fulvimonas sp. R45]MDO1527282.1 hypothetical protein [Fulvimonas sp. R45]
MGYLLAVPGLLAGTGAAALDSPSGPGRDAATARVSIHIRSDHLTLRVAKAPQVYLSGNFGTEAVRQVQRLLGEGKIPPGSDVYLDSSSGDVASGMALGRLFRAARLNTHLGAWREASRHGMPARPATCLDACAYAWLGGLYRWSPSGADRIGLHEALLPDRADAAPGTPAPQALRDYMQSMDVRQEYFAQVLGPAVDGVVWWNAEKMAPWLVANNGRLPLTASYAPSPGAPTLVLTQVVRGGQNRIELQCASGQVTLTAYDTVGEARARQLAARAVYAYFEVDRQAWDPRHGERPHTEGDALVFARRMPFVQLAPLLRTVSLGAWVEIAGSPVRLGFSLAPVAVAKLTQPFYASCLALQPGAKPAANPAKRARPSFWKRIFGRPS